jgi:rubrerythrin
MTDFGHDEVVQFFMLMAREEESHRVELVAQRSERCAAVPAVDVSQLVPAFEGPHSQAEADALNLRQALALALAAERRARSFFLGALDTLTDPEARTLFGLLAEEEIEHVQLVQRHLDALAPLELA